jgi:hypothetical protein
MSEEEKEARSKAWGRHMGAAFIGPVIATTLLSWTSPPALYLVLAAMGAACLPLAAVMRPKVPA